MDNSSDQRSVDQVAGALSVQRKRSSEGELPVAKKPKLETKPMKTATKISRYFQKSVPVKDKAVVSTSPAIPSCSESNGQLPDFLTKPLKLFDSLTLKKIVRLDLDLDYGPLFGKSQADEIFQRLEKEIEYYTGQYTQLKVFGKWHQIPRKQVAYGDAGLTYAFSGNCLPAKTWTPLLAAVRDLVQEVCKTSYNFVLVNRYNNGNDHIGEHRDDEKDLDSLAPIASLSFGQQRDFILRHKLARTKGTPSPPPPLTVPLQHGSLLLMNPPTNQHWYHSLPVRKKAFQPRINLTFRRLLKK